MTQWRTRLLLACCLPAAAMVRCTTATPRELEALPVPGLELGPPATAQAYTPPPGWPRIPIRGEWACRGWRPWRLIVIHHSSTDRGSAAAFERMHRARGWDELGYHFVIDNGQGGPDGRVEVGRRWRIQKWGAHTGGTPDNEYNNFGIGVCLVGDFQNGKQSPTPRQLAALEDLVSYLAAQYDIPPQRVVGHRDAPGAATDCPGDRLYDYLTKTLRPRLARQVATRGR